jgi:hypothetical protein
MNTLKAHQSLVLASDVLAIVASGVIIWKLLHANDATKLIQMRMCRATARFAKQEAELWTHLASNMDTKYYRIANVTS